MLLDELKFVFLIEENMILMKENFNSRIWNSIEIMEKKALNPLGI